MGRGSVRSDGGVIVMAGRLRSIEQERAACAWKAIEGLKEEDESMKKKYRSLVKRVAPLILINGLGQTMAFLKARREKDGGAFQLLFSHISSAVKERVPFGEEDLLSAIVKGSPTFLKRATREALAYLQWLSKFAEAELPAGDDEV